MYSALAENQEEGKILSLCCSLWRRLAVLLIIIIKIYLCIFNVHTVIKIKWTENKCNVSTCFIFSVTLTTFYSLSLTLEAWTDLHNK